MKGVILAGGLGTRLSPLTRITNKHLLPLYDKPMIYYPIHTLVEAGITEILIVTGGQGAGDFLRLLGDGKEFGLTKLHYTYQRTEGGIADALRYAAPFVEQEKCLVILGDNILRGSIKPFVDKFRQQKRGARILLKEVPDPEQYGVPTIRKGKIQKIVEKPKQPDCALAVIGVYMYDPTVFKLIETLKPSKRGELEVTDLNNAYLRKGQLYHDVFDGWWADAGASIDGLYQVNRRIAEERHQQRRG